MVDHACLTVRQPSVTPLPAHQPRGKVDRARSLGVRLTCDVDHVVEVVVFGQARSKKDPSDVDVIGDVASIELSNGYT